MSGRDPSSLELVDEEQHPLALPLLPSVDCARLERLTEVALRFSDAYTQDFVERYFLCPFAREGRKRGESRTAVVWHSEGDEAKLLAPLFGALCDPSLVVLQVVFPHLTVKPEYWVEFCARLSSRAHALAGAPATFAVAALHPRLSYRTETPYGLIPLFRRAPDPTLQWVRLSTLEELHRGREKGSSFVDAAHLLALLTDERVAPSLYDKVAQSNQDTLERLGLQRLVSELEQLHRGAQRDYDRILSDQ